MIIKDVDTLLVQIKKERERKKISQAAMAERLGVTQSYYSQMESGKRNIDFEVAGKICDILEIILEIGPQEYSSFCAVDNTANNLLENAARCGASLSIGEMLTGKIEQKSEGKSVSIYLSVDALENLEKFAKANGCSKSKAVDLVLRNLY